MQSRTTKSKTRFSLYCLQEGEQYFDEAICTYFPPLDEDRVLPLSQRLKSRGRLRLCSHSLFFEPDEHREPIVKFDLRKIVEDEIVASTHSSAMPNLFVFQCPEVVHMMQHGFIRPHQFVPVQGQHLVSLMFIDAGTFLKPLNDLLRASRLGPLASDEELKRIMKARESNYKFNYSWLADVKETVQYEHVVYSVLPLVCIRGRLLVTSHNVYFQAFNNISAMPVLRLACSEICYIEARRYMLREIALELQTRDGTVLYLAFEQGQEEECRRLRRLLSGLPTIARLNVDDLGLVMTRWQHGEVSNFDYLMFLNSRAGRSMNDLSQYPVMPWVLQHYQSETLDLSDPAVYRDLRRPIGALNAVRLGHFKERRREMDSMAGVEFGERRRRPAKAKKGFLSFLKGKKDAEDTTDNPDPTPKVSGADQSFLYGSHYSTPGYVVFFRVREVPEYMLLLQKGRMDAPDRLFSSIPRSWHSVLTNPTDVKELIPEFFCGRGTFLRTDRGYDLGLGTRQDGTPVAESVELPPWAKDDPAEFIRIHRQALEGPYVSANLHHWYPPFTHMPPTSMPMAGPANLNVTQGTFQGGTEGLGQPWG